MNADWQRFLESIGGAITAGEGVRLSTAEQETVVERSAICDLSRYTLISVAGDDAEAFLQGQLSNDTKSITSDDAQVNAYCNAKGRVYSVVRVTRRDDGFLLQLPRAIAASVLERLRKYVLRAKVRLENDPDLASLGVIGGDDGKLALVCGTLPATADRVTRRDGLQVIRHRSATRPRYQIIGEPARLAEIWTALAPTSAAVSDDLWRWLDIRAGMPEIGADTAESFIPQMINLDLIDGVSFNKGCYPGQEIVARMHYLGKLKQRMFLGHLESQAVPSAADQIVNTVTKQKVGQIVNAQASPDGGVDLLAVLRLEAVHEQLTVGSDTPLQILPLPYATEGSEPS